MLLDRLAGNFGAYRQALLPTDDGLTRLHEFPIRLLGALLNRDDAEISTHRLLDWLTVCADTFPGLPESLSHHIDFRLRWRPGLLEELLPAAVEDCLARDDPERCLAAIDRRVFGARPFPYGTLCIERALAAANPLAVDFYLSELAACFAGGRHAAGTTVDRARAALSRRPELIDRFDRAMSEPDARHGSPNPPPDTPAQGDWQRRVEAWQSGPSAATDVLHSAAEAYLGVGQDNEGATPTERLRYLVGSRRGLADALLEGFRRTVRLDDLPTPRQVVRLATRGSIHHVSLPVLAALDDLAGSGQPALGELGDRALRLAVTLLYTFPPQMLTDDPPKPPRRYCPKWLTSLLKDNPGLVADVLEACVLAKLGLAIEPAAELEPLVSDPDHAAVARLVAPRLLRAFPGLDTATACASLAWTLKAALLHADRAVLSNILAARLADSGTASGQRRLWLAAAFLLEPGRHRDELLDDTADGLFDVVFSGCSPANLTRDMAPSDLELLVARLADGIARRGLPEPGEHTVSGLIGQLADAATPDATRSLASLASDVNLAPWVPVIDAARHRQARGRREREFRHPNIHQIALTLDNRAPANPPDFKALLLDVLDDAAPTYTALCEQVRAAPVVTPDETGLHGLVALGTLGGGCPCPTLCYVATPPTNQQYGSLRRWMPWRRGEDDERTFSFSTAEPTLDPTRDQRGHRGRGHRCCGARYDWWNIRIDTARFWCSWSDCRTVGYGHRSTPLVMGFIPELSATKNLDVEFQRR